MLSCYSPKERLCWADIIVKISDVVEEEEIIHNLKDHRRYGHDQCNQVDSAHNLGCLGRK